MSTEPTGTGHRPPSDRSTVTRGANRAVYDPAEIRRILEAGLIAHVGVSTDDGPVVLPMAYGLGEDELYLHGSVANALLRSGRDHQVCVTVTHLDGLVVARTPFHNSMNYRSVVVRGEARRIEDADEKLRTLKIINDHVVATWDTARPPSPVDLRQTLVLAVPLADAAAKVRAGDPIDEPEDHEGPWWAGVIPLRTVADEPVTAADNSASPPDTVREFRLP